MLTPCFSPPWPMRFASATSCGCSIVSCDAPDRLRRVERVIVVGVGHLVGQRDAVRVDVHAGVVELLAHVGELRHGYRAAPLCQRFGLGASGRLLLRRLLTAATAARCRSRAGGHARLAGDRHRRRLGWWFRCHSSGRLARSSSPAGGLRRARVALDDGRRQLGVTDTQLDERTECAVEVRGFGAKAVRREDAERHAAPQGIRLLLEGERGMESPRDGCSGKRGECQSPKVTPRIHQTHAASGLYVARRKTRDARIIQPACTRVQMSVWLLTARLAVLGVRH